MPFSEEAKKMIQANVKQKSGTFDEIACLNDLCAVMDKVVGQDERTILRILTYLMNRYVALNRTVYITNKSAYSPPKETNAE